MPLEARRLIRKMRGGAQAHLIEAEDGQFYVVKFSNNPQHRRVLVNELIAGVFLQYLGISTPEMQIISITSEFLRRYPETGFQWDNQRIPAAPGWHWGSRYPGHPDRVSVYDYLPDVLLRRVTNLREFAGILAFDKWMGNSNGRQAVFVRPGPQQPAGSGGMFFALMIDQGYVLNGPFWDFPDAPLHGLYHRPTVYEPVTGWESFQPWLDRILHFPVEVMDRACKQVPLEWMEGEEAALEAVLEKLLERRQRVPDLIEQCRRARAAWFPNWRATAG
ncbi:MAG: HipA family kinase [Bryobacteraceae bacterium]